MEKKKQSNEGGTSQMITIPDTSQTESQTKLYHRSACTMVVVDEETKTHATDSLKELQSFEKRVKSMFKESKDAANRAHKSITALEKQILAPVQEAIVMVKEKILGYSEQMQLERAKEKQEREDEMRAKARAEQLMYADELMENKEYAKAVEVLEEPIIVAGIVDNDTDKDVTIRETYKARVTSITALARAVAGGNVNSDAIEPNMIYLNKMARTLKEGMQFPGVQVYIDKTVVAKK